MKIALIVGAALLGAIVLVLVAGYFFPREHTATSTIDIPHPQDSVWMAVRDLASTVEWWPDVQRVERIERSDGREAWRQVFKSGPMPIVVENDDPPRRLVTRVDAPDDATFGGTWTYALEPVNGGTRVSVTEAGFINNPLFRFMANVFFGMHGTMDSYLVALGRRFGVEVTVQHR